MLEEDVEGLAGDDLDEAAEDVEAFAVRVLLAGVMVQGKLAQALDAFTDGDGFGGEQVGYAGGGVELLETGITVDYAITEAGGALFPEHHDAGRGDGLGLGGDAEDVVALEFPASGVVRHAVGLVVDDAAVAGDERDHAGYLAFLHRFFAEGIDACEAGGRDAGLAWIRVGERRRAPGGRGLGGQR